MALCRKGAPIALAALFAFWGVLAPGAVRALDGRGYLELDAGYKTGDFGTPTKSSLSGG